MDPRAEMAKTGGGRDIPGARTLVESASAAPLRGSTTAGNSKCARPGMSLPPPALVVNWDPSGV